MKKSETASVAVWCILSVVFAFIIFHMSMNSDKISQFISLTTLFMVGLGLFFVIFRSKISILLGNYKREKEI